MYHRLADRQPPRGQRRAEAVGAFDGGGKAGLTGDEADTPVAVPGEVIDDEAHGVFVLDADPVEFRRRQPKAAPLGRSTLPTLPSR